MTNYIQKNMINIKKLKERKIKKKMKNIKKNKQ